MNYTLLGGTEDCAITQFSVGHAIFGATCKAIGISCPYAVIIHQLWEICEILFTKTVHSVSKVMLHLPFQDGQGVDRGYTGDSAINTICDTLCFVIGFMLMPSTFSQDFKNACPTLANPLWLSVLTLFFYLLARFILRSYSWRLVGYLLTFSFLVLCLSQLFL